VNLQRHVVFNFAWGTHDRDHLMGQPKKDPTNPDKKGGRGEKFLFPGNQKVRKGRMIRPQNLCRTKKPVLPHPSRHLIARSGSLR